MFTCTHIDHVGINTNDMEATLQFYCGVLGMRLVRTTRTPDGRRHYNVEIGGGNAFAVFDGAELPVQGERQHVNHLAMPVATPEEFDAAYQRLKDHGVAVTEIIERGYGKTFYFHDPNGIRESTSVPQCVAGLDRRRLAAKLRHRRSSVSPAHALDTAPLTYIPPVSSNRRMRRCLPPLICPVPWT
jgi:catechol 2,3-dioxygenase-like lactoylglutathione lyase family enzyme